MNQKKKLKIFVFVILSNSLFLPTTQPFSFKDYCSKKMILCLVPVPFLIYFIFSPHKKKKFEKKNKTTTPKNYKNKMKYHNIKFLRPSSHLDQLPANHCDWSDYQLLTPEVYVQLLKDQYYNELKILFLESYHGDDQEEKWNYFFETKQRLLTEDLEKLKYPLKNHECEGWSDQFISNVEKSFQETEIVPKAIHYKTFDLAKEGEETSAYVNKNSADEYELYMNPADITGLTWRVYMRNISIFHELSHIIEGHLIESKILKNLSFFSLNATIRHKKIKEAMADRRLCVLEKDWVAESLKELIFEKDSKNFMIGFSKERIPQFQLMIHCLDVWWLIYEKPSECGKKIIEQYPGLQTTLKAFFTKENIKYLLETDDSTWDVKRIKTIDYPPKFIHYQ